MSAREKLIAVLAIHESNRAAMAPLADEILAEHARELAAAIRSEGDPGSYEYTGGWEWAADLIDPDEEP